MRIRPGRVSGSLAIVVLALTAAQLAGLLLRHGFGHDYVHGLVPLFDFDREHNIPSLYSAASLLCCSGLLALLACESRRALRHDSLHWGGLSFIFLMVAIDEQFALHERLILPLQDALPVSGYFHFAWVIPYGLLTLGLGIIYLRFLLRFPVRPRMQFLVAAVLYLSGALGMEMVDGAYYERIGGNPDLPYMAMATLEELLEMSGVIVFVHGILSVMAERNIQILFVPDQKSSSLGFRIVGVSGSSPRRR